ncbi:MAG TPA: resolvase [Candidatus Latescibacteria bacterium]|nr:resolvase [Candidatus Latescibacterota bacterium]|tara:strand:+ start:523 stop:1107 length:585 start_codon:yes stop_codon:yes gene_type:complete
MAPRTNARVAIYARVSTTGQDAGMQLRELREYAHQRGLEVVDELVDTESGSKDRRPELDRLWTLVRSRKVDTILVYRFDRFARSTKQLVDALEEFNHLGVDFISLHEQIDTSSPMGKAMFTIIGAMAEFEREIIRERVRSGLAKAKAQGKKLGRPRVPDKTISRIRTLRRDKGMSLGAIAKELKVPRGTVQKYA